MPDTNVPRFSFFCSFYLTEHFDYETSLIKGRVAIVVGGWCFLEKNPNLRLWVFLTRIWWFFTLKTKKL